jgi:hypothetical protein
MPEEEPSTTHPRKCASDSRMRFGVVVALTAQTAALRSSVAVGYIQCTKKPRSTVQYSTVRYCGARGADRRTPFNA